MTPLAFTGERFTPECVREIWYEHVHRYALARQLAAGKRVLDMACGEGYGAALVAPVARHVTGVDLSAEAIAHARRRYGLLPNLDFIEADATCFDPGESRYDLALSFETLEHVEAQEALVAGLANALAPGGCALVSSPDKAVYSDQRGYSNEFHVRELYRDELLALLGRHFRCVRLYGQRLMFHSTIWALDAPRASVLAQTAMEDGRIDANVAAAPMYFIAVCAQRESDLLPLSSVNLFADEAESVYAHYHHEIRKHMQAGAIIAERDATIAELQAALARAETRVAELESKPRRGFWPFARR